MGKVFECIDAKLAKWIGRQRLFFVATAPSDGDGHVNCSPKGGIETFRIVDDHTVAYLDLIGSGIETVAHLRENGRIVVMFCAFEGPPRIVRLHGRGTVIQVGEPGYDELQHSLGFDSLETADVGARGIVTVDVERVADSCGYGVPLMSYEGTDCRGSRSRSCLVPPPVMFPSFWVASTKRCKDAGSAHSRSYGCDRGRGSAQRASGPEAGGHCWRGH